MWIICFIFVLQLKPNIIMRVETNNQVLGIGDDLVMSLLMAMDIYYETIQAVSTEKKIKGTINPILTKKFKGKGFYIKAYDDDISNLVEINLVEICGFGVEIFLKGKKKNESINISYDTLILSIKNN